VFLLNAKLQTPKSVDNQWEMFLHFNCSSDAVEMEEKQLEAKTVVQPGSTELVDVVAAIDMISESDPVTQ